MTDFARLFGFQQRFQCAAGGDDGLQVFFRGVVNLIKVDVIRAEIIKAYVNILRHRILRARHTLCSENEFIADAFKRISEIFLADRISARGIDIVHAFTNKLADQLPCALGIDLLDRNASKPEARYFKSCFS